MQQRTDFGRRARVRARYWAVDVVLVTWQWPEPCAVLIVQLVEHL
jgi:hypothetical protein